MARTPGWRPGPGSQFALRRSLGGFPPSEHPKECLLGIDVMETRSHCRALDCTREQWTPQRAPGFGEDLAQLVPSTTSQPPTRIHIVLEGMTGNLLPPCDLRPPSAW